MQFAKVKMISPLEVDYALALAAHDDMNDPEKLEQWKKFLSFLKTCLLILDQIPKTAIIDFLVCLAEFSGTSCRSAMSTSCLTYPWKSFLADWVPGNLREDLCLT